MGIVEIIGIAVALAIDATTVAIAVSVMLERVRAGHILRFAITFGVFQGVMPIIGWFAGSGLEKYIRDYDHWVAFFLLLIIGMRAIRDSFRSDEERTWSDDPTTGITLVILGIATSIDALAVGLNFGLLSVAVWIPAIIIALVTAGMTTAGMLLGGLITSKARKGMQIIGGVVLIVIGVKIVIDHLIA